MKRISKELWAVASGFVTAYVFQLVMIALIWLNNTSLQFDIKAFIPMLVLQVPITPIASWFYMGIFGVRWQKRWNSINKKITAIVIPYVVITMLTLFIFPIALEFWQFWVANTLLAITASLTICSPKLSDKRNKDSKK